VWSRIKAGSVDSLRELRASFDELDKEGKGYITLEGVMAALAQTTIVTDLRHVKAVCKEHQLGVRPEPAAGTTEEERPPRRFDHHDFKTLLDELMDSPELRFQIRPGSLMDEVIRSKKAINVKSPEEDQRASLYSALGQHCHSVLYSPVINEQGKVVAIIEAMNRSFYSGAYVGPFTDGDVRLCRLLCSHVAQFMKQAGFGSG